MRLEMFSKVIMEGKDTRQIEKIQCCFWPSSEKQNHFLTNNRTIFTLSPFLKTKRCLWIIKFVDKMH